MTDKADPKPILIKSIMCGSPGVGKSTLWTSYFGEDIRPDYVVGIGVKFAEKVIKNDGLLIQNQVWNLAGQPELDQVRLVYFKGARVGIFVFDRSRQETLFDLEEWIKLFVENCGYDRKVIVVGIVENKIDLESKIDTNTIDEFQSKAEEDFSLNKQQIKFFQTCAINNNDIDQVFSETVEMAANWAEKE